MSLIIGLKDIPEQGITLEVIDDSWFPDQELHRVGKAVAYLHIEKNGRSIICNGDIEVPISLICDRCCEDFTSVINADFSLTVETEPCEDPGLEHTCSESEMESMYVEGYELDGGDLLRQQLMLALPMKNLCAESCRGLCSKCGSSLNQGECGCTHDHVTSFSVLKKLLNN